MNKMNKRRSPQLPERAVRQAERDSGKRDGGTAAKRQRVKELERKVRELRRRKYLSIALLVIDELGFEPMNLLDASQFFRLVPYC